MKKAIDRDAIDFLPDALAVRHSRLPWWIQHGVLILLACFLVFLCFSFFARVDVIISANGKLVSDHPTVMLKPLERTVIKDIKVSIGQRVKAGDILATFDPVFSNAEKERLISEVQRLEANLDRLNAEMQDEDYILPANANQEQMLQRRLFEERKKFYAQRNSQFDNEIASLLKTRTSLKENIDLQSKRLSKFKDIESMLNKAGISKAVSSRDLKDAEITRMQLEADISDKKHNILVLESDLKAKEDEKNAFSANWNIERSDELVKTKASLVNAQKELDKAAQMAAYVELHAPEDAVVHDIAPISRGSAIREAETLFTLVPTGGNLEAEVEIRAEDVGKIKVGDKAKIKVSAFPFQKYGTVPGEVRLISEDSYVRGANPEEEKEGSRTFYKARIAIDENGGGEGQAQGLRLLPRLIPGMETQVDILTGERRILEYLVHPIIRSLDEAIREP